MAVVAKETEGRVLLHGISWATYESLVADMERSGRAGTRLTYDQGWLEIMPPSHEHERLKRLLGRMIEAMTEELGVPISSAGSTTFKTELKERGLEPDECYWVTNEAKVRGRDKIDLSVDPPPDLAIEVEVTSDAIEKLPVYADLGVPEVWRYDGRTLKIYILQASGTYAEQPCSSALPRLLPAEIERFLDDRNTTDETTWIRSFRAWVQTINSLSEHDGCGAKRIEGT